MLVRSRQKAVRTIACDGEEVDGWFTDPNSRDTDGDGYSDGEEVAWGDDPLYW